VSYRKVEIARCRLERSDVSDASDWSDGVGGNFSHLFMSGLLHQGGVARKGKVWGHLVPEKGPVGARIWQVLCFFQVKLVQAG